MADFPEIPGGTGGVAAALGAGSLGAVFLALKVWRWLRQEFRAENSEKQQEAFQQRTMTRAQEVEKKLEELQREHNKLTMEFGVTKGEASALLIQLKAMTENKDYWRARALDLEKHAAELDKNVELLSAHLAQAQFRLAVARGELDASALMDTPLSALPEMAQGRLGAALTSRQTAE